MDTTSSWKVPIRRLSGPRKAWLELKGTVLIYHETGWMGSASVFIPIEWVSVSRRLRYHSQWLLGGVVCLAVFLTSGTLASIAVEAEHSFRWIAYALGAPTAVSLAGFVACCIAFLRRRPTTLLSVDSEPQNMQIEFWHDPVSDQRLTALLAKLKTIHDRIDDVAPYPIQTSHTWYRLRPLRAVLAKGLLLSAVLYFPVTILAQYYGWPLLNLFVVLPPLFHLGRYGFEWLVSFEQPRGFRRAVKLYDQGSYAEADRVLKDCARNEPENHDVMLLWMYVCLELRNFDKAFEICRGLAKVDEEAAEAFTTEIWSMKRMYDRMEINPDKPSSDGAPADAKS
ncbi:MAG: hypothetical protein AMXMBFR84_34130 [Candidatus Hydrogenedentota bacterium]